MGPVGVEETQWMMKVMKQVPRLLLFCVRLIIVFQKLLAFPLEFLQVDLIVVLAWFVV